MRGNSPVSYPAYHQPASSHCLEAKRSFELPTSFQSIFVFKSITPPVLLPLMSIFLRIQPTNCMLPRVSSFAKTSKLAFMPSLPLLLNRALTGPLLSPLHVKPSFSFNLRPRADQATCVAFRIAIPKTNASAFPPAFL